MCQTFRENQNGVWVLQTYPNALCVVCWGGWSLPKPQGTHSPVKCWQLHLSGWGRDMEWQTPFWDSGLLMCVKSWLSITFSSSCFSLGRSCIAGEKLSLFFCWPTDCVLYLISQKRNCSHSRRQRLALGGGLGQWTLTMSHCMFLPSPCCIYCPFKTVNWLQFQLCFLR